MREIKFRAWDGEKMHYWDSVTHKATGEIEGTPYPKLHYLPMSYLVGDSNDWVWMQNIGMTDHYGKDIYEGDVISAYTQNENINNPAIFYEVSWYSTGFFFRQNERLTQRSPMLLKNIHIIGSIYENPDLIKTQND